ncbi:uncharacterized protein (DUF305 family) [Kribbella antiqua]|uniref:Uncharacterized protein (DUF305 family) n=1 Tax=Kribbella antiqua TaxID=2512217 RepID=A0A4R2IQE5_9ACTN|nr:DUF305 domain-containing protein [Kribbella antiqua]TCO47503.1 uncharacterized protein (DUF305 family) [Kribbella antiqua]
MGVRRSCAAAVLAVVLAGCSTPTATVQVPVIVPGTPGGPNQTVSAVPTQEAEVDQDDVTFLADMMVHHTQAIQLTGYATTSATNQRVKALADRIRAGQQPEIDAMRQLLVARGQTPPNLEHVQHLDHSGMPGMATPAELAKLEQARGKAFDRLFLTLMIKHHQGAVTMTGTVIDKGTDAQIGEVAQEVGVTQTKEIATMRQLLKEL